VKNYALFEDDVEVDTRPNPKHNKEQVESSNTSSTRRSSADSGPHKCRFCGQEFKLSQSLGGHMNRHRSGKLLAKIDFIAFILGMVLKTIKVCKPMSAISCYCHLQNEPVTSSDFLDCWL
jgi:hypothetical protein